MKRGIPVAMILVLGLTLVLGAGLYAQVRKDTKTGLDRVEGYVLNLSKDNSTLTVRQSGTTQPTWKVKYNDQTKFTMRNAPAKLDDLKDGQRVIVLGKLEKDVLAAVRIDIRSAK
jgi:hypothetical protein